LRSGSKNENEVTATDAKMRLVIDTFKILKPLNAANNISIKRKNIPEIDPVVTTKNTIVREFRKFISAWGGFKNIISERFIRIIFANKFGLLNTPQNRPATQVSFS
jgi:hypothetical protein